MAEFRRGQLERAIEEQLPERRAKQVGAAHHLGDPLGGVIDHDGELVGRHVVLSPDDEIAKVEAGDGALRTGALIEKLSASPPGRGNASSFPPDLPRQVSLGETADRCPDRVVLHPRGGARRLRSARRGASNCRDRSGRGRAVFSTLRDRVRVGRFAEWGLPPNASRTSANPRREPPKFWPATVAIEIFDAQHERAVARAAALLCAPESEGVAGVQVTGRRGREPAAIWNFRLQISDFRLKSRSAIHQSAT